MKNIKALNRLDAITIVSEIASLTITVGDLIRLVQIEPFNIEITGEVKNINNHQLEVHEIKDEIVNKHTIPFGIIEEIEVL